jgi:hypothetical protein
MKTFSQWWAQEAWPEDTSSPEHLAQTAWDAALEQARTLAREAVEAEAAALDEMPDCSKDDQNYRRDAMRRRGGEAVAKLLALLTEGA